MHWLNFKKYINRKKILKNENPNKIIDIVEKILKFNKKQKGKGLRSDLARIPFVAKVSDYSNLKILTPKQMLQMLPIALAQVKVGNTSENLLNEFRQNIYIFFVSSKRNF